MRVVWRAFGLSRLATRVALAVAAGTFLGTGSVLPADAAVSAGRVGPEDVLGGMQGVQVRIVNKGPYLMGSNTLGTFFVPSIPQILETQFDGAPRFRSLGQPDNLGRIIVRSTVTRSYFHFADGLQVARLAEDGAKMGAIDAGGFLWGLKAREGWRCLDEIRFLRVCAGRSADGQEEYIAFWGEESRPETYLARIDPAEVAKGNRKGIRTLNAVIAHVPFADVFWCGRNGRYLLVFPKNAQEVVSVTREKEGKSQITRYSLSMEGCRSLRFVEFDSVEGEALRECVMALPAGGVLEGIAFYSPGGVGAALLRSGSYSGGGRPKLEVWNFDIQGQLASFGIGVDKGSRLFYGDAGTSLYVFSPQRAYQLPCTMGTLKDVRPNLLDFKSGTSTVLSALQEDSQEGVWHPFMAHAGAGVISPDEGKIAVWIRGEVCLFTLRPRALAWKVRLEPISAGTSEEGPPAMTPDLVWDESSTRIMLATTTFVLTIDAETGKTIVRLDINCGTDRLARRAGDGEGESRINDGAPKGDGTSGTERSPRL